MKTPSFNELQTLVDYYAEELMHSQLQEVHSSDEGLVLTFYRFVKEPKTVYLVFDLDVPFPFLGLYFSNPWPHIKKTKPVGLFLNSHGKNLPFSFISLSPEYGRVVHLGLGKKSEDFGLTLIEFRMIPKQANLLVSKEKKSISWCPVKILSPVISPNVNESKNEASVDAIRTIPFMLNSWLARRGHNNQKANRKDEAKNARSALNPYEKWKLQKQKDLLKKQHAVVAINQQINDYLTFPWNEIGEHLKTYGIKNLKPEWHQYLDFSMSVSKNIQFCFAKSKSAKVKILGAQKRLALVQAEIANLSDLSEEVFAVQLLKLNQRQVQAKKTEREVQGRFRKMVIESANLVCYMGKSAKDNLDLLRKAKAWDIWMHLKDYPSAHVIIHRQKDQTLAQNDLRTVAGWLIKENFRNKMLGTKYAVVYVECRFVRPIKGDKLGRVTYHEAAEFLIAL